jgi:hypothetical protein
LQETHKALYHLAQGLNALPNLKIQVEKRWGNDARYIKTKDLPIYWKDGKYPFDGEVAKIAAWEWSQELIEAAIKIPADKPLPNWLAGLFNNYMASEVPVSFYISCGRTAQQGTWRAFEYHDLYHPKVRHLYDVAQALWVVLPGPSRGRLKRCPQCMKWFVDESRNRSMSRCSQECTNKYWNRARRRDANHRNRMST